MNRTESVQAGRRIAADLGVDDDQEVDLFANDELFAAYALIHEQTDIYRDEVAETMAGAQMQSKARCCAADAEDIARLRAEELLGRALDREATAYRGP